MDLISTSIRTIFYDSNVAEVFYDMKKTKHAYIEKYFNKLAAAQDGHFTLTEYNALRDYVKQTIGVSDNYRWSSFFNLLPSFNTECLSLNGKEPVVEYNSLMRWRELSLLLGEDILTTSYLARQNVTGPLTFDWPNVLRHNSVEVNALMDNGVADIHAHLKASADIFELTWLDLMHYVVNRDDEYKGLFTYNESIRRVYDDEKHMSIHQMIQAAAYLRAHLYDRIGNNRKDDSFKTLYEIFKSRESWTREIVKTQSLIDCLVKASGTNCIDYCIRNQSLPKSIFAVHIGERKLLYDFFSDFYSKQPKYQDVADYMFLYVLIKIRIRHEFIQTNKQFGFEYFKEYEARKSKYAHNYQNLYNYYAVQSSFRQGCKDMMETRIAPFLDKKNNSYTISIPTEDFSKLYWEKTTTAYTNIDKSSLTYVVHMLKRPELNNALVSSNISRFGYRHEYRRQIDAIIEDINKREHSNEVFNIVGLDAAGNEINCSPAVFGHAYRYARARGLKNLTYHVGEDFYDLTDGLMNIYNAILFLDLQEHCRLGHAIALGIHPEDYYRKRDFQVVCSRQRMLDILGWVLGYPQFRRLPKVFDVLSWKWSIFMPAGIRSAENQCFSSR